MTPEDKREIEHELQLWLDRRRQRRGNCEHCGKPYAEHRAKVTDPANGCALAELLSTISDVMVEQQRNGGIQ
jgi:hypothetical protein